MTHAPALRARGCLLIVACCLLGGCASETTSGIQAPTELAGPAVDKDDGPALLLLMSDQLLFEPFAVRSIFRDRPELHEQLALALGRIGDPRALPYLESLLQDPVVEVRRAAAFALGQLGDRRAHPNLLGALGDSDREVGRFAVAALARLEIPLARVEAALDVLPEDEKWPRLLPELFRFAPDDIHRIDGAFTARAASEASPDLERWLLYALARSGDGRGASRLRAAFQSRDPWIQSWAARSLGRLGDASDIDRLHRLLQSPNALVVSHALSAAARLIDAGAVAAPAGWLADLERLVQDERTWVRLSATGAAGSWRGDSGLRDLLRDLAASEEGRIGELALLSLARSEDVEAGQLVLAWSISSVPSVRRAASAPAVVAGFDEVVEKLLVDEQASVRVAALTAVLENAGANAYRETSLGSVARQALLDPDPGMRAIALDWLAANPVAPLDELIAAVFGDDRARMPALSINGAAALEARAGRQPLERGAGVAALERLAEGEDFVVRRAAADALVSLGRPRPLLGTVASRRALRDYRSMLAVARSARYFEIKTERGSIVIELDAARAPLSSVSFAQLARAGFFDSLILHRVVPGFVAQGGDPRGDGLGGPGFTLRDENNRLRFERGVVGMARSGKHTAGSQFFLTMSPQPHLDGSYTAFGRVVAGDRWLDGLEQGDRILSVAEVDAPRNE